MVTGFDRLRARGRTTRIWNHTPEGCSGNDSEDENDYDCGYNVGRIAVCGALIGFICGFVGAGGGMMMLLILVLLIIFVVVS